MEPLSGVREVASGYDWWAPAPALGVLAAAFVVFAVPKRIGWPTVAFVTVTSLVGFAIGTVVGAVSFGLGLGVAAADNQGGPTDHRARRAILTCGGVWAAAFAAWVLLDERRTATALDWWPVSIGAVVAVAAGGVVVWRYFRPRLDPQRHAPASMRRAVLERDGHRCVYCGADGNAPGVQLVLDHVTPHSHGGRTHPRNLVTACAPCNTTKGDRSIAYLNRRLRQDGRTPLVGDGGPFRSFGTLGRRPRTPGTRS